MQFSVLFSPVPISFDVPAVDNIEVFHLLSHLHVLDITTRIARKAGKIYTYLREKGLLVSNEDILIAASCIFYKIYLLTKSKSHFDIFMVFDYTKQGRVLIHNHSFNH